LVPMLNMRFAIPDHLIDINGIRELSSLQIGSDRIELGATVRQATLLDHVDVRETSPLLIEALSHVGHMQTRSRGTIGGSLCHLDPAAELPLVATALDAVFIVVGPNGRREVKAADWSMGFMTTALAADELLTRVSFPVWRKRCGTSFVEFSRRRGDFAIVAVAACIRLDQSDKVEQVAVAIGGVAQTPIRSVHAERTLIGARVTSDLISEAATAATNIEAISDTYYTASYRRRLVQVLVARAVALAVSRAKGDIKSGS
ncbi:MAG TPA: FAD binding domain-containing protein, partial [Sphingomicrobium sp.]|nr:FAD binding domain-containing protein [Sphingomicrobium sp.]